MNTTNIIKKMSFGLASVLTAALLVSGTASAIPYTGDTTVASPVPAFNVFTGNMPAPAPKDGEPDFFQSRVPANGDPNDSTTQYTDPTTADCTDGKLIQMRVYVHNGASADNNDNGTGPSIAHNSKVSVTLPSGQATSFDPTATISSSNAATVTDGATINCNGQSVKLQYVPGSASQYSLGTGVLPLSDSIVNGGVSIRSEKVPGDVWGCWNERVFVLLSVKVVVPQTSPPVTAMCNLFTVEASSDRKVKVNQFKYTAQNANFKSVVINWGDNAATSVTNAGQVIGTTHQYGADGTYLIAATVHFSTATNPDLTSGGPNCSEKVTFKANQPPIVTPPTTPPTTTTTTSTPAAPTALVNTGPGSVAGLFAATAAIGAAAHRWALSRRLSRQ